MSSDMPQPSSSAQPQDTGLPPNWEVRLSKSKNLPYYFNTLDTTSRWEPPAGTDTDKLKVYMARYHSTHMPADGSGPGKIRAAHLLVKHRDSRRPSSWKQDRIVRTKEEARAEIEKYHGQIVSGQATLAELATQESDCSSARKRGDLGWFGRGDMQKEFEDAAFALKPGEISDIVESASGLHLIERLE